MKKVFKNILVAFCVLTVPQAALSTSLSASASSEEKKVNYEHLKFSELPPEISTLMVNFPEDTEYIYLKEDYYIRLKGDFEPFFYEYAKDGAESMPGSYTTDYSLEHYKEEPMIDFYYNEDQAEGWTHNIDKYGNYYFFGKYMAMKGDKLEMIFARSNKEFWDKNRDRKLPFPKFHKFLGIDLEHTLKGFKEVNDLKSFYSKVNKVIDIYEEIDGRDNKIGILDMGGCAIISFFKGDIAGYWFISTNSPIYKADYSLIDKKFPAAYVTDPGDPENPTPATEKFLWNALSEDPGMKANPTGSRTENSDYDLTDDEELVRETISTLFKKIERSDNFTLLKGTLMTGGGYGTAVKYFYDKEDGLVKLDRHQKKEETDLKKFEENFAKSISYNYGPIDFMDKLDITGTSPENIVITSTEPIDYKELLSLFPGYEGDSEKKWKFIVDVDTASERYHIEIREVNHDEGVDKVNIYSFSDFNTTELPE